jgi:hypothetical protein
LAELLRSRGDQAGLDAEELLSEPRAFVDRSGEYRAPFGVAVKVAGRCCRRFAGDIPRSIREREEELRTQLVSGDLPRAGWASPDKVRGHARAELERAEPVFALARVPEDLAPEAWDFEAEMEALGFRFEPFGEGALRITAVPGTVADPEAALLACKGSTRFGEDLCREEMEMLLREWSSDEFRDTNLRS